MHISRTLLPIWGSSIGLRENKTNLKLSIFIGQTMKEKRKEKKTKRRNSMEDSTLKELNDF